MKDLQILSIGFSLALSACGGSEIQPMSSQGLQCGASIGVLIDHGSAETYQELVYQQKSYQISDQSSAIAKLFLSRIHQAGNGSAFHVNVCFSGTPSIQNSSCGGLNDCPPVSGMILETISANYPVILQY